MLINYFYVVRDNETPEEKEARETKEAAEAAKKSKAGKTFTQEQVNDFIAKEKGKLEKRYTGRIERLEALKDDASLTATQKADLEDQIEEMKSEFKTKAQLAEEEAGRMKKTHDKEIKGVTVDRDIWKSRYTDQTIQNAIINAAVEHEAFDPEQIVALLKGKTKLTDKLDDDGKKTGELVPVTHFTGLDEDEKEIELDINPGEAVKRMVEMAKYDNLFKRSAEGGLGANKKRGKGSGSLGDTKNIANYRKQRKEGKIDTKG